MYEYIYVYSAPPKGEADRWRRALDRGRMVCDLPEEQNIKQHIVKPP